MRSVLYSLTALAAVSSATPFLSRRQATAPSAELVIPSSGLPPPDAPARFVMLGLGTQNYTCEGLEPTAVPTLVGAVAKLYDLVPELEEENSRALLEAPGQALRELRDAPDPTALPPSFQLAEVGDHDFAADGTPVFRVRDPATTFLASLSARTLAPPEAFKGLAEEGAVDWLRLERKDGSEGETNLVYRVVTAGGKQPATCEGAPAEIIVQYATQYWFF